MQEILRFPTIVRANFHETLPNFYHILFASYHDYSESPMIFRPFFDFIQLINHSPKRKCACCVNRNFEIYSTFLDMGSKYMQEHEYDFLNHSIPIFDGRAVQIWNFQKNSSKSHKLIKYTKMP